MGQRRWRERKIFWECHVKPCWDFVRKSPITICVMRIMGIWKLVLMHLTFPFWKCATVQPPQRPQMHLNCQHIACNLHFTVSFFHSLFLFKCFSAFVCRWTRLFANFFFFYYIWHFFFSQLLQSQWLHSNYAGECFFCLPFEAAPFGDCICEVKHAKPQKTAHIQADAEVDDIYILTFIFRMNDSLLWAFFSRAKCRWLW